MRWPFPWGNWLGVNDSVVPLCGGKKEMESRPLVRLALNGDSALMSFMMPWDDGKASRCLLPELWW